MKKINMIQLLKSSSRLLRINWKSLISLEAAYRLLEVFLLIPLFSAGFKLVMNISGYRYLTIENIASFLVNPLTILLLLLLILIIAAAETWHIGTVICILDMSAQNKSVSLLTASSYSVRSAKWIRHKGRFLLALFILFMLPFLNLGTGIIGSIKIPEFILDTILHNSILSILLAGAYLLLLVFVLRWIFSLCYLILDGDSFSDAAKKSSILSKGHLLQNFFIPLAASVIHTLLFDVAALILIVLVCLLYKADLFAADLLMTVLGTILTILILLFSMLGTPISLSVIIQLFYDRNEQLGQPIHHVKCEERHAVKPRLKQVKTALILGVTSVTLILGVLFIRGLRHGDYNLNIEHVRTMEVSAHRGASAFYPENTMAAFKGAVSQNADWIELDVQQSSDGEIFVMHDINFERTTGVNKNCWEMTWAEISKLDAGSFFSEDYAGEPIPLLKDVIRYAKKTGIRLNIELKPTGYETDFEKKVIDIIRDENFSASCVVTSQVYEVLENIKKYDDSITTVYVMAVAIGDIEALNYADSFSIEASFVNSSLVERMHSLGKEVYAWTIDTEENINSMIEIGVDNIISNNVPLAKKLVEESRMGNVLVEMIHYLID